MSESFAITLATPDVIREVLLSLCQDPRNQEYTLAMIRLINSRNGNSTRSELFAISTASPDVIREILLTLRHDSRNSAWIVEILRAIYSRSGNSQGNNVLTNTDNFTVDPNDMNRDILQDILNEPIDYQYHGTMLRSPTGLYPVLADGIIPQPTDGPLPSPVDPLENVLQMSFDHSAYLADGLPLLSSDPVIPFLQDMPITSSMTSPEGMVPHLVVGEQADYFAPQFYSSGFTDQIAVDVTPALANGLHTISMDGTQHAQTQEDVDMTNLMAGMQSPSFALF